METQHDLEKLEQRVAEKRENYNKHRKRANQLESYDRSHFGAGQWRTETLRVIEAADNAQALLQKAERELEKAQQQLEAPQPPTNKSIPDPLPTQTIEPETNTSEEQTEDHPIDAPHPAEDEDTQHPQDGEEAKNTTGTNILNALTKKFSGNKIVDKLLNKMGDKHE